MASPDGGRDLLQTLQLPAASSRGSLSAATAIVGAMLPIKAVIADSALAAAAPVDPTPRALDAATTASVSDDVDDV